MRLAGLLVAVALVACASAGRDFDTTHVTDVQKGVQDKGQIKAWFGEPHQVQGVSAHPSGCAERWTYTYAYSTPSSCSLHQMHYLIASRIVPRTTVDIEAAVLRELKRLQKREGKPLGQLISELVTAALAREEQVEATHRPFAWTSRPMRARIDLEDKEAVRAALESA